MTDPDELGRLLSDLAAAFETLGTVWAVGGSVASSAYGEPRATNDVDVIAALDETSARKLPDLLGASFYLDADAAVDAVRRRSSFNGVDTRSFIKVDVFVPPGPGRSASGSWTAATCSPRFRARARFRSSRRKTSCCRN